MVEEDQFINLDTGVQFILICEPSSHNNPTISSWLVCGALGQIIPNFFSTDAEPDSFTIIGTNVVHRNMGPARGLSVRDEELSIL